MSEQKEGTFLGKKTDYKFHYDKSLLLPIPRSEERGKINLLSSSLPFLGYDIWNCYEFSTLNHNGLPVVGILKIVYPCTSESLIESKSLKLYLNGFSMTQTGGNKTECLNECEKIITRDLSEALGTTVYAVIHPESEWNISHIKPSSYINLEDNLEDTKCTIYKEDSSLLQIKTILNDDMEERLYSPLVRSCCKITHQPDFGTYYIKYTGKKVIDHRSLLQYLVSFRDEWHFHEECAELTFKRLYDLLEPKDLCVACFYTRRGGIDINIIRSTSTSYIDSGLLAYSCPSNISFKLPRQ